MAILALAAAGASVLGNLYSTQAKREADEALIKSQKYTAIAKYSSTEFAANIMKDAARSSAVDAVGEILRVGGAEATKVSLELQKYRSKSIAQSEGLTSGISKGREARAFEIQANKVLSEVKSKTTSEISKILDAKDKVQNDINNKLLAAHNELKTVLAQKLPKQDFIAEAINLGTTAMAGYSSGASFAESGIGANIESSLQTTLDNYYK